MCARVWGATQSVRESVRACVQGLEAFSCCLVRRERALFHLDSCAPRSRFDRLRRCELVLGTGVQQMRYGKEGRQRMGSGEGATGVVRGSGEAKGVGGQGRGRASEDGGGAAGGGGGAGGQREG
jgi:hypothetical protein